MQCPVCHEKLRTYDSRCEENNTVLRRRECKSCLTRFTTKEKIDYSDLDDYIKNKLHLVAEAKK